MRDLKTVLDLCKDILTQYPQTRNCDGLLYLKVLEHHAHKNNIELRMLSVPVFLTQMADLCFPPFESVRRNRQKLQARFPELAACETVQEYRAENEAAYLAHARSEVQ